MKKHLKSVLIAAGIGLLFAGILAGCSTPQPEASPTEIPQNISTESPELVGDPVRGGLLYDEWWAVPATGEEAGGHEAGEEEHMAEGPTTDQPLWKTQTTNTRSGADTWRCKECHGWDYQGVDGAYGSGSHKTGFPGTFAARNKPATEILAILKGSTNPDHDFSKGMDEQALSDLALFMAQAQVDTAEFVNVDGTSKGEAATGKIQFEKVCMLCHGPEGNAINFNSIEEPEF